MNGLRPYVLPLFDRRLLSPKARPVPCSFIVTLTSSSIGPLVSLVMFLHMGSTQWRAVDCRAVLLAGLALSAPALALMCAFNDDKALLDHERHRQGRQATGRGQQAAEAAGAAGGLRPATAATAAGEGAAASLLNGQDTAEAGQAGAAASCQANGGEQLELLQSPLQQQQQQQAFRKRGWHPGVVITVLIGFSDLVGALASGGGCSSTLETPPPAAVAATGLPFLRAPAFFGRQCSSLCSVKRFPPVAAAGTHAALVCKSGLRALRPGHAD